MNIEDIRIGNIYKRDGKRFILDIDGMSGIIQYCRENNTNEVINIFPSRITNEDISIISSSIYNKSISITFSHWGYNIYMGDNYFTQCFYIDELISIIPLFNKRLDKDVLLKLI